MGFPIGRLPATARTRAALAEQGQCQCAGVNSARDRQTGQETDGFHVDQHGWLSATRLAVGSDYNLLVVSRLKEEIHAGLQTGIIRGMGATGRVVTAAGLVFAFTMASMIVSDLRVVGHLGTTIGFGLLVDTLIVRSFMTPSIAAALGHGFWWPLNTFRKAA